MRPLKTTVLALTPIILSAMMSAGNHKAAEPQGRTKISLRTSPSKRKAFKESNAQVKNKKGTPERVFNDSLPPEGSIKFSGYDKTLQSSVESVLISNGLTDTLTALKLKVTYFDLKGRMIHSRELQSDCLIPPEETRKLDFKSWDPQHTYFYHLGPQPKQTATPYSVTIALEGVRTD